MALQFLFSCLLDLKFIHDKHLNFVKYLIISSKDNYVIFQYVIYCSVSLFSFYFLISVLAVKILTFRLIFLHFRFTSFIFLSPIPTNNVISHSPISVHLQHSTFPPSTVNLQHSTLFPQTQFISNSLIFPSSHFISNIPFYFPQS